MSVSSRLLPWLPAPMTLAASALLMGLGASFGAALMHEAGRVAGAWPANGLLLGLLLGLPLRQAPACIVIGFLANLAVDLAFGYPSGIAVLLSVANAVEIGVATTLSHRLLGQAPDLSRPRTLWHLVWIGCGLAPALSAIIAAETLWRLADLRYTAVFYIWYLSEALGLTLTTPLVLNARCLHPGKLLTRLKAWWPAGMLGLQVATGILVFAQNRYPIAFLAYVPLLLVVEQLGLDGALAGLLLLAASAIGFTIEGFGPFRARADMPLADAAVIVELYLAVAAVMVFATNAVRTSRQRIVTALVQRDAKLHRNEARLRESEARYRLLSERTSDAILRVGLDGVRRYVSPAARQQLGYSPEELVGKPWQIPEHPDDAQALRDALVQLRGGREYITLTYRRRHKEGHLVWIESNIHLVHNEATGAPEEFVIVARDVTRRIEMEQNLAAANAELARLAQTDPLTGLANRRGFDTMLDMEWRRTARDELPLGLLMIDVDFFKRYNDIYGHPQGDACLSAVAGAVRAALRRPADLAARYGGEEFAVLLPDAQIIGAIHIAERVRAAVQALQIPHVGNPANVVTVSIGAATTIPTPDDDVAPFMAEADRHLYDAKGAGRNSVRPALRPGQSAEPGRTAKVLKLRLPVQNG